MEFFQAVLNAVLSALSVFAAVWLGQRAISNDNNGALVDACFEELSSLHELSASYWVRDFSLERHALPEQAQLEVQIKYKLTFLALCMGQLRDNLSHRDEDYASTMSALFDAVTGGQFEVTGRPADYLRMSKVNQACRDCIVLLLKARKHRVQYFKRGDM